VADVADNSYETFFKLYIVRVEFYVELGFIALGIYFHTGEVLDTLLSKVIFEDFTGKLLQRFSI